MLFNGESKGRVVSSSGKKKDVSRNTIIEDSRKQREQRVLDKKRTNAAILLQKHFRRYLSQIQLKNEARKTLHQQLLTISQIEKLIPDLSIPLETVLLLMKLTVRSKVIKKEPENWKIIMNHITKFFRSTNSLNSLNLTLTDDVPKIHSFQIILSAFCREFISPLVGEYTQFHKQIIEFLQTLLGIITVPTLTITRSNDSVDLLSNNITPTPLQNCVKGVIYLLRSHPHQIVQKFINSPQSLSQEMEDFSIIMLRLCQVTLPSAEEGSQLDRHAFLGFTPTNLTPWSYFTQFILSVPNLFDSNWSRSYLNDYCCSRSVEELSTFWRSVLSSISLCQLSNLEFVALCSNFFFATSRSHGLLTQLPSRLWINLASQATQNDQILLKSILLYHNPQFQVDNSDDEDLIPLDAIEKRIRHSQINLVTTETETKTNMEEKENDNDNNALVIRLTINIVNSLLQPALLRYWLGTVSTNPTQFSKEESNLVILFARLLIFTPPEFLTGITLTSQSVPHALRMIAYDHTQILLQKIWSDSEQWKLNTTDPTMTNYLTDHIYFLLFLVWNQLLTMDDVEFSDGSKSLTIQQFTSLGFYLKDLLYHHYWIQNTSELLFSSQIHSITQLSDIQLMYIGSKVFNNLITRNERLKYCSPDQWTWSVISPSEFEVDADFRNDTDNFPIKNFRIKRILEMIPQVIPFFQRARLFQQLLEGDKSKYQNIFGSTPLRIEIQRDHLLQSAFDQLYHLRTELKREIKVTFINSSGLQESGIDGGGLFKEFIDDLMKEMCQERWGFFKETSEHRLVPNNTGNNSSEYLQFFSLLGALLGKAIYEKILVEPIFAGMFLNHLLGRTNLIDDLPSLDEEIYRNLLHLKKDYLHGDGDIEQLGLTFEVHRENFSPTSNSMNSLIELIPNGCNTPVTKSNLLSYIYHYANFKLNTETGRQCHAFLSGFRNILPTKWIRIFSAQELQMIIGGDSEKPLDLLALQRHCTYSGGYHPSQPYIQEFWKIIESLPPETQREFLRFVTSCSRQPILGFDQLIPPFNIMKIPSYVSAEDTAARLPMASACFNQFKLPQYDTLEELRTKVLYAINSKSGFELT